MKKSKIRRNAKRQAERDAAARREKFLREIDAPKRRLEAEIAARGKSRMNVKCGGTAAPDSDSKNDVPGGCPLTTCSESSFVDGGFADSGQKSGKNTSVIAAALAHLSIHLVLLQGYGDLQGAQDLSGILEVPLAHSELGTNLGDRNVVGDPRVFGTVVGGSGTPDTTTPPHDKSEELATAELRLTIKDGVPSHQVAPLSQGVSDDRAKSTDEKSRKESEVKDMWLTHFGFVLGGMVGCAIVCAFIMFIYPNVKCGGTAAPDSDSKNDVPGGCPLTACSHLGLFRIALGIIPKRFAEGTRGAFFLLLSLCFLPYGILEQVYYRIKLGNNPSKMRRGTWLLYGWGRAIAYAVGVCHLFSSYRRMNNKDLFGCQGIIFPANASMEAREKQS